MVNRYGPWMDTNTVIPITPSTAKVVFDYYLDVEHLGLWGESLEEYVESNF
jgi:hypothetical protein